MSNFIRTKDRVDLLRKDGDKYIVNDSDYTCEITVDEETLLKNYKVADTIDELCDEFVGVDKTCENGHQLLRAIPYKCANFWNGGVYGAIWTDKGLIYVAKMNDKGELELI